MKKIILANFFVSTIILASCGASSLMQGSGTTGVLPFYQKAPDKVSEPNVTPVNLEEVMTRWNVAAAGVTVTLPRPGSEDVVLNFLWNAEFNFPHPTFRWGTAESYEAFSLIFIRFCDTADNLAYLKVNNLLDADLVATTASGQGNVITSFQKIAGEFSQDTLVSEGRRVELARIHATMVGK